MTATVNLEEVERFNALAQTWWDPSGPMWPLHRLNAARVPFIMEILSEQLNLDPASEASLKGLRVLDVGCGAGLLSESMAVRGAEVTGVDPAERNIAIARGHAEEHGLDIDYRCGSVEALDCGDFDVVLNMEVVEHVDDLHVFMSRCGELTAVGGLQFVATINRNPLSWLVAIFGAEYVLRWLPRGTHQWRKFVKPLEVESMLGVSSLETVARRGVSVNPFTRQISVTDFMGVNYMLAARRLSAAA
ncbi:MAG: bifunctional 2-polyprenyl-6-hydroxyphenol methylase/3-demethylubiquinol 3-O-methyltransferase UbiG [Pseudomonadota bacterium]